MANDIDRTLAEAAASAKSIEEALAKTNKALVKVSAEKFARHIRDGAISGKELREELEKADGNLEEVNEELRETIEKLKEAEERTERWNKGMKEIGEGASSVFEKLTGIKVPGLSVVKMITAAAETTVEWLHHTAKVNRQFIDMSANLGDVGKLSYDLESNIRGVSQALNMPIDDVREIGVGLAAIGFTTTEIKTGIKDVAAMTEMWSEITPEKQMSLMSDYMKEFGMNGKEATNTMLVLYDTANKLKKDVMPKLDIKAFVDQTHEVALEMRQYGLEAQDAIALTSTLAQLGVEQARIPELARGIAGAGMGGPATVAYMATQMPGAEKALERGGITEVMGEFLTAEGDKRLATQTRFLDEMLKAATGGAGITGEGQQATLNQIVGALTQLDLPGIGKMTIEQAKEFGKGVKELQDKGVSLPEALGQNIKKTEQSMKDARDIAAKHFKTAQETATHTKDTVEKIGILTGAIGSFMRETIRGEEDISKLTPEQLQISEKETRASLAAAEEGRSEITKKQSPSEIARLERQAATIAKLGAGDNETLKRTMAATSPLEKLNQEIDRLSEKLAAIKEINIKIEGTPLFDAVVDNSKKLNTNE